MAKDEIKGQIRPQGYIKLVSTMLEMLHSKKRIANWDDLKTAEKDCIMELQNKNRDMVDGIKIVWDHYREMVDLETWYNDL